MSDSFNLPCHLSEQELTSMPQRRWIMSVLIKLLLAFGCLGFILAAVSAIVDSQILGVTAEGYSRACTNLVLIAIALSVKCKE